MGEKQSFKKRFRAWWEGYDLPPEADKAEETEECEAEEVKEEENASPSIDSSGWSEARIALAEKVFGDGLFAPGGAAYAVDLVKPLNLDPSRSVLDLAAGLGNGTRAVCQDFGVWIEGMEASEVLAAEAKERSIQKGLAKKAPVEHYDPETVELKPRAYNCVYAREGFYNVTDKERLFDQIRLSLRDDGQLLFTDFSVDGKVSGKSLDRWSEVEPRGTNLWSPDKYKKIFAGIGFELRVAEDRTELYHKLLVDGWTEIMDQLGGIQLSREETVMLMREAEMWARRTEALNKGGLKLYRWHLLKRTAVS